MFSRHARRFFPDHEELNVTARRVQTGLELSKRSKQNLPPWRQCHRAAGARAESCHYTVSLSARDTSRHGGIRAARGDNSFINIAVITVIRIVVLTIIRMLLLTSGQVVLFKMFAFTYLFY